jgi:large subunit ribosomal protein L22
MIYQASHKFARISASKVRPFAALVRGRAAKDGMDLLRYVPNRGAAMLLKVLRSACGNASDRGARDIDELPITISQVDEGPMFKRLHARARGMAYLIRRRFAHITIGVGVVTGAEIEAVALARDARLKDIAERKARLQSAKEKRDAAKTATV